MNGNHAEIPWSLVPVEAVIIWHKEENLKEGWEQGYLHFYGPDGNRAVVPVTKEAQTERPGGMGPIWHIEIKGNVATVSPSIHFVGHWHSPNPVRFQLVESLRGENE